MYIILTERSTKFPKQPATRNGIEGGGLTKHYTVLQNAKYGATKTLTRSFITTTKISDPTWNEKWEKSDMKLERVD